MPAMTSCTAVDGRGCRPRRRSTRPVRQRRREVRRDGRGRSCRGRRSRPAPCGDELVGDGRADEAGAAGDEDPLAHGITVTRSSGDGRAVRRRGSGRAASRISRTRRPASPSVSGARRSRIAAANSATTPLQRLALGQRGRDHVADPVRDRGGRDGSRRRRLLGEVDALVVDAEMRCVGLRSSHTSIRREPPMIVVRIFVGLSQLTCTWAIAPSGRAAASGSRRRPGRRRSGRRRAPPPPSVWHPSGRMKSRIDRSCGARSQNTSTSGWTRPRLMRTESTYWRSPSSPPSTSSTDALHRRRVAVGVVAHQHEAPRRRRRPRASRPSATDDGERLLDQHVLARVERRERRPRCASPPAWRSATASTDGSSRTSSSVVVSRTVLYGPTALRARSTERSHTTRSSGRTGRLEVADQVRAPVAGADDGDT